ncbi:MAG: Tol biopolymer transport system component, partial [Saprospiraceae bacterium]
MKVLNLVLVLILSISTLNAQDEWDVNNPPEIDYKKTKIQVKEGTWLNVDEHKGKIVFDLLGDIYTMPLTGGKATAIRTGIAWEVQPRFSPDGKKILFTSDAGGGDNIWSMNADGSSVEELTKEDFRLLNNAVWTPDGDYFVARKHFTSGRSLGAGEMWLFHKTGGAGTQLTKRKNDQQDVNEPCFSPDGRYLYYSEDDYPGGYFQYNKDPNDQIYAIKRYDRETGKTIKITGGPGGAMRPQISPDGKQLAYVHRIRTKTVLMRHNLETGEEFVIFDGLSKDQSEAWAIFGTYPGFDWLDDNRHVIIWGQGKINKVNMFDKKASVIPFEVNNEMEIAETLKFENAVYEKEIDIKVIRHAVTSPDEKTVVFNAIGHIWSKKMPNGKPQRLTDSNDFEFEPAFSSDGKSITYVTWNDKEKGAVKVMDLATKVNRKVTTQKGIYRTPSFSPDGTNIVFRKDGGNSHQGYTFTKEPGIYITSNSLSKEKPELVSPKGEYPVFSKDGKRIFYQTGGFLFGSLTKAYHSIKVNGSDDRKIADAKYAQRFSVSPDNQWIAWSELYKVFIAPMPQTGQPIGLSAKTKAVPVAQVAKDAGINLHWSSDSKKLHWTLGEEYFTNELTERFTFLENAVDSIPPMDSVGIKIGLKVASDKPGGMIAFINARIITMQGDKVIENGTIIIQDNEIMEIGASADIRVPGKAKVIDAQ